MRPTFYYHPRMLEYDFGPQHPFRPERLALCVELLSHYRIEPVDPGVATEADALRVHSTDFLETFKLADRAISGGNDMRSEKLSDAVIEHGFASGDNPPFPNMW